MKPMAPLALPASLTEALSLLEGKQSFPAARPAAGAQIKIPYFGTIGTIEESWDIDFALDEARAEAEAAGNTRRGRALRRHVAKLERALARRGG